MSSLLCSLPSLRNGMQCRTLGLHAKRAGQVCDMNTSLSYTLGLSPPRSPALKLRASALACPYRFAPSIWLRHLCTLSCTTCSGSLSFPPSLGLRPLRSQNAPLSIPSTHGVPPHLPLDTSCKEVNSFCHLFCRSYPHSNHGHQRFRWSVVDLGR